EKENGIINLTRAAKNGHSQVVISKLAVLSLIAAVLSVVFYGSILVLGNSIYGFGDISRYLQSMSSFRDCNLLLTVKEYILLFISTKVLTAVFTSLIFAMFFNLLSNAKAIYVGLGLFMGVSYISYTFIHPASYINGFKYLNIFAFFNVFTLYGEYTNINLLGFPGSKVFASMLVFIAVSNVVGLVNIFAYVKSYSSSSNIFDIIMNRLTVKRTRLFGHTNLFLQEAYKVFVANKVYLIIIIALIIGYNNINFNPLLMDNDTAVYKTYVDSMTGRVTLEKEELIQMEQKRFDKIPSEIQKLNKTFIDGSITKEDFSIGLNRIKLFSERQTGFERLKTQNQYLLNLKKEKNIDGSFICELSSNYIFNNKTRDLYSGLLYSILLILCLSNIFPMDYKNGMIKILKCTWHGRIKLFAYKCIIGKIIALILMIIVYLPYYINLIIRYDIKDWSAPIQSISIFSSINLNISILGFVILTNLLKTIGCFAMVGFILLISQLIEKQSFCILASTILFCFPLLMNLMDIFSINSFTLNTSFALFSFFTENKTFSDIIVYFSVLSFLSILAVLWGGLRYSGNVLKTVIDKLKSTSIAVDS
ncbi:MAG: hypothetical protein ACYDG2_22510, partial [Ruminiclostridium sp.]